MRFTIPGSTFQVCYNSNEDGGGTWFGQEYNSVIQKRYRKRFNRCLEWCSGPGFIGFGLLANNLCDTICLMDRYEPAGESVRETARINGVEQRTTFYCCDRISSIPDYEKFDLIVANPPHYLECPGDDNYQRIAVDQNWQAHWEFYQHIGSHMHSDSVILLQENQAGSLQGPAEFKHMIERSGLKITGYFTSDLYYDTQGPTQIYYLEVCLR